MGTGQFTQITHVHKESQHASRKQQNAQKRAHTRRKAHCIAGAQAHTGGEPCGDGGGRSTDRTGNAPRN